MNEDYRLFIESAKDGFVVLKKGTIFYVNRYFVSVLGLKREDIVGRSFFDFIAEEQKDSLKNIFEKDENIYEIKFQKKDGNFFLTETRFQKIDYNGEEADLLLIRDVTTRKKIEEVFRLQEERFHGVAENTPDIIARFDKEYRYVYINEAGAKEYGIPKKDFFWKTDKDLGIDGEMTEAFREAIDFVFEKKERKTFYGELLINGEKKYFYTILVPEFFKDGEINSVLSITRDITEIREIDEIKTEFISITSHQLRSPLSVINWCIISLLKGDEENYKEDAREYLEKIEESTRKLIKITDVFLNTTMLDLEMFVFNVRELDLVTVVREIIREFEQIIEKKEINFTVAFDDFPLVKFDSRVLKIVFRGLLSNAIDYTPKGGNVDFVLKKNEEKEILLEVGDSGCGVLSEDQKKIFTKFYRSETARNMRAYGTGLDLYLIKSVLDKIGGSIEMQSPNKRFDKGSAFFVKIPTSNEKIINS
jgi:PAS domain S-box-containing protein